MELPQEMLILAGGLGTRLRAAVSEVPKPMAPILGRPFLEYLIEYWIKCGVRRFVLSVGYKADVIRNHFSTRFGGASIEIVYEAEPLGTGGGIRAALTQANWTNPDLLIANGDTWLEVDTAQLLREAEARSTAVTIVAKHLPRNDRYGGLKIDPEGLVTAFGVPQADSNIINGGCYLANRQTILSSMEGRNEPFSFEKEVLMPMARQGLVGASVQEGMFLDIGVPADYVRAQELLGSLPKKGD